MDRNNWKNKWAAENPEAYKKYQREYRAKRSLEDPEFRKRIAKHLGNEDTWVEHIPQHLLDAYKIQKSCEICGTEFNDVVIKCLDHDHITRTARGALCRQCNSGLGQFKDNLHILTNAISYLQKHKDSNAK